MVETLNQHMYGLSKTLTDVFKNNILRTIEYHEKKTTKGTVDVLRFYFYNQDRFIEISPCELNKNDLMLLIKGIKL